MFEAQKPWYEVTKGISSLRFVTNGGTILSLMHRDASLNFFGSLGQPKFYRTNYDGISYS